MHVITTRVLDPWDARSGDNIHRESPVGWVGWVGWVGRVGGGRRRRASMPRRVLLGRGNPEVRPAGVRPFRGGTLRPNVVGMLEVMPHDIIRIAAIESHNPVERVLFASPCKKELRSMLARPSVILKAFEWLMSQSHWSTVRPVHLAVVPNTFP
jgi:hypothetical protein